MIKVENYVNVEEKAQKLNLNIPSQIAVLPRNFKTATNKEELIHAPTTPTVRKLWKQNNIRETPIEKHGEKIPCSAEKAFEWIGPIIFISSLLLSQNPHLVNIALNVISNYLTEWFRGVPYNERKAKLSIVLKTRSGDYKEIKYEGFPDGLDVLQEILRRIHDEK
ncbi:MAG: hypothetical protein ACTSPV_18130 [Candidatus Hodarchaeales archaeon]